MSIVKPAELVNRQSDDTLNNADTNRRNRPTSIGFRPFSSALIDRLQRVNVWRWLHASNNHACRRRAPTNFRIIRDKIDMPRGYPREAPPKRASRSLSFEKHRIRIDTTHATWNDRPPRSQRRERASHHNPGYRSAVMSDSPPSDRSDGRAIDTVDVELPLDTRYIATLRLIAASLAADARFSVDEIDDLRLALSEVWALMADRAPTGRVAVRFTSSTAPMESGLTITLGLVAADTDISPADPLTFDDLGRSILTSVVDSYAISGHAVSISKRPAEIVHG